MLRSRIAGLVVLMLLMQPGIASADVIDFESGFTDQQTVIPITLPGGQTVTFSTVDGFGGVHPAFIAQRAGPVTAFAPGDTPFGAPIPRPNDFFLTDQITTNPDIAPAYNYRMSFTNPTSEVGLYVLDFRVDTGFNHAMPGDSVTLSVFSGNNFTGLLGTDTFTLTSDILPEGNYTRLRVKTGVNNILSATVTFSRPGLPTLIPDLGTAIDEIQLGPDAPEPATIAVWAALGVISAGWVARRSRTTALHPSANLAG